MESIQEMYREELKLALSASPGDNEDFAKIYGLRQRRLEAMAERVVTIHACGGFGSGVMLDSNGHIATNAHVISDGRGVCNRLLVRTAWGSEAEAEFITGEYEQDVAIIKVTPDDRYYGVEIAPEVYVGQDVYAIGHPLGNKHTITRGIVSYLNREVNNRSYVQTDASINPGNSGGGLFDDLGRLVGLPTFKEVWTGQGKNVPVANLGFAVPGAVVAEYYQRSLQRKLTQQCNGDPEAAWRAVVL
ncbi:MAG: trypsin-like serine protease [Firmicutes bacterium]|nr:trypsin-like serine protease [Bacillota bacterium]